MANEPARYVVVDALPKDGTFKSVFYYLDKVDLTKIPMRGKVGKVHVDNEVTVMANREFTRPESITLNVSAGLW